MSFRECNHVKSDGLKCKSPALNRQSYCYFHHRWNKRQQRRIQLGGPVGTNNNTGIEMPILESYEEIQIGIMEVLQAIIDDRVSGKRAGLMLYALQLASTNTRLMQKPGISQPGGVTDLSDPELDVPNPIHESAQDVNPPQETVNEVNPSREAGSEMSAPHESANEPTSPQERSPARECGELVADDDPSRATARRQITNPTPAEPTTAPTEPSNSPSTQPSPKKPAAPAPAPKPAPDPLAGLRLRYPGIHDELLPHLVPQPNDEETRLYFSPDDSIYQRQKIKERRILLGIYL